MFRTMASDMAADRIEHRGPSNAMAPAQMHREISRDLHADCTVGTCEMLRGCWTRLIETGHPHPTDSPADCSTCTKPSA